MQKAKIRKLKLQNRIRPNENAQKWIGGLFLPIVALGFFFPWLGFAVLACMIIGLAIAFRRGRKWCDFWCPRGSFLEYFLTPVSPQKKLPKWIYSYKFRLLFIAVLFSFLIFNIALAWLSLEGIAFAFVKTLTITTIISIILAVFFRSRTWCVLCPVGTFSGLIGGKNDPLEISFAKCLSCTNCSRVCPMGQAPYQDRKVGTFKSKDCLKCETCVVNCPSGALRFKK